MCFAHVKEGRTDVLISLNSISKSFDKNEVIHNFSLSVNPGEHIAIMGQSGCGKTTLLRIIAGLEQVDSGEVSGYREEDIAFVFQESRLFDTITVLDNVACVSSLPMKQARAQARKHLETVGLSEAIGLYPHELSGGMAQRVQIARAFMADKPILLLDEPFSALDDGTRQLMIGAIKRFAENRTMILVTHNRSDAEQLADSIIELSSHKR